MYLISACLLGLKTRFDGKSQMLFGDLAVPLRKLIPVCPEQLGGLPTPRFPAEILGGQGKDVLSGTACVLNNRGENVTELFLKGARETLRLAFLYRVEAAFLKDGSPSCGSCYIYDGSFSGQRCKGAGVTAALLQAEGIPVYNEYKLIRR